MTLQMKIILMPAIAALYVTVACSAGRGTPKEATSNVALSAEGSRSFVVSSYASTYPLQGRFEGTYTIEPDSVVVLVRRGGLRSSIPARLNEMAVLRDLWVAAGFGIPYKDGWTIDTLAPEIVVAPTLAGEAGTAVGALRFAIPRRPGESLEDRWLIFQVGGKHAGLFDRPAGSRMANYVCADDNLLGPTEASRERSRRMKREYSKIC